MFSLELFGLGRVAPHVCTHLVCRVCGPYVLKTRAVPEYIYAPCPRIRATMYAASATANQPVNLCGGLFDERVADSLVAAFVVNWESHDNITQIDMRSAVIDAGGLRSLYTGWRKLRMLTSLNLSHVYLGPNGAYVLASALLQDCHLKILRISCEFRVLRVVWFFRKG
jgi:hypothetical protein